MRLASVRRRKVLSLVWQRHQRREETSASTIGWGNPAADECDLYRASSVAASASGAE